ncbi:DNA-directed RNA polymerase III subunit RPC9 [Nephila pilipes]|uniref:DNA-directed RNA polymerase III subunit RPC9 n=1 Tax=Nephila pilipes TaxID=299642 RepID=A0A8X6NK78_NEPPI|nr:DNA-directed RNA polymerase III subunit RPC9 [Nephila pilipes]
MEVIKDNAALLSNIEVLTLLDSMKRPKYSVQMNEMKEQLSEKEKSLQRFNTIVYETVKYIEEMPCATQTPESVKNFLKAIAPYSLTKAEKLQLLNMRPTSLVEIQLLIEESEERFNEDQMNEILRVVSATLPPGPEADSKPSSEVDYEENG